MKLIKRWQLFIRFLFSKMLLIFCVAKSLSSINKKKLKLKEVINLFTCSYENVCIFQTILHIIMQHKHDYINELSFFFTYN